MSTAITFMVQNLRVSGRQTADTQGQRVDTLGRSGQANELYSRARRFRELVRKNDPDVILTCEGKPGWVDYLEKEAFFADRYGIVYHWDGTDAPPKAPSCSPILYRKERFDLADSGCFWMSETPEVVSYPYGDTNDHPRVVSWAKLREKESGEELYAYAVHIHNRRNVPLHEVGVRSMKQLIETCAALPEGSYAFLGGDYNIDYRDPVYETCMDWSKMVDLKDQALYLRDAGACVIGGNTGSVFTRYERPETGGNYGTPVIIDAPNNSNSLDHLMARPHPHMKVDFWGYDYTTVALPEENVAEGYVSDHYALVVKVQIGTVEDYSACQRAYEREEQ